MEQKIISLLQRCGRFRFKPFGPSGVSRLTRSRPGVIPFFCFRRELPGKRRGGGVKLGVGPEEGDVSGLAPK